MDARLLHAIFRKNDGAGAYSELPPETSFVQVATRDKFCASLLSTSVHEVETIYTKKKVNWQGVLISSIKYLVWCVIHALLPWLTWKLMPRPVD